MALAATLPYAFSIGLCLLLAWAIWRRGAVGLIAGYDGELSPEREAELARDAAVVLLFAAAAVGLLVVDIWTDAVPRPGVLVTLGVLGPTGVAPLEVERSPGAPVEVTPSDCESCRPNGDETVRLTPAQPLPRP